MDIKTRKKISKAREAARYIIRYKATIRKAACKYNIGKSTLHVWLTSLKKYEPALYAELKPVLDTNFEAKAYRGGKALQKIKHSKEGQK